jgi:hypothetical protein
MSMLATALTQFDEVAGRLDLEPQIQQHLRHPRASSSSSSSWGWPT